MEERERENQEVEEAKEEMSRLEEGDPPEKLEDWPDGRAKYLTYGGPEGTAGYDEGPTEKLGPSSLEHHEDGSVSIEGEKVDNPDDYKTDPIPGALPQTRTTSSCSPDDVVAPRAFAGCGALCAGPTTSAA